MAADRPRQSRGVKTPDRGASRGFGCTAQSNADQAGKSSRSLCRDALQNMPPLRGGGFNFRRSWTVEETLDQHRCLLKQHGLQFAIGRERIEIRKLQIGFARLEVDATAAELRKALIQRTGGSSTEAFETVKSRAVESTRALQRLLAQMATEEHQLMQETQKLWGELEKSNKELEEMRESIEDVTSGGGPKGVVVQGRPNEGELHPSPVKGEGRKLFYCSDCKVGGHGQRFCNYLLQRPNWRVYPSEKWFENKGGQVSFSPVGKIGVDFADETHFSRISMHILGRIWLEDKRKLYEFVPEFMPLTYVIKNQAWVGERPPDEADDAEPMPWFVKETDRNWGISVLCCQRPQECMALTRPNATYVVQKHIPNPLLYYNGEKCHIKFYTLLVGLADGVTWRLYTYKDGYLSISPNPWTPTDLSKETQVTIIRTKRINDWPHWEEVYPNCKARVAQVIERAVKMGKLEGRNKIQFEIISADYIVTTDKDVYLLEFNTGPVLRDPGETPDVHDAGMVSGAMHIVEPWEGGSEDEWELAIECQAKGVPRPRPNGD